MKAILTKLEKERLLEQFEKSGKTHAQFAEENGLNVKTYQNGFTNGIIRLRLQTK